jgi:hypothetical protein
MALVRRIMLLGQTPAAKAIESAVADAARAYGVARVPHQPDAAPGASTHPATQHGAPPPGAPPGPPPNIMPPVEMAAASPAMPASIAALAVSFGLVAVGAGICFSMPLKTPLHLESATAAYGGVLVFAAAVERLLEPFSHWLPGRNARNRYEAAIANMLNGHPNWPLDAVARAKAEMNRAIANRAVIAWGLATGIAATVASASGFYLLRSISAVGWTPSVPPWIDALITGLVVGSGTKPVHDLITKAQTRTPAQSETES